MSSQIKSRLRLYHSGIGIGLACGLIVLGLSSPPAAQAAPFNVMPGSSGTIQYSAWNLTPGGGPNSPPIFSNGMLISAGNGYSLLGSMNGANSVASGPIVPSLSAQADSSTFGNAVFGNGRSFVTATSTTTGVGGQGIQAGTFFTPVAVNDIVGGGTASVSVSTSSVTFQNPGQPGQPNGQAMGTVGDTLSVKGSLDGLPSDFVEAAITGTYSINGAPAIAINPIIVAFNGRANSFIEEVSDDGQLTRRS